MQDLQERVITCPECLVDNTFVGSYQGPHELIHCWNCGAIAGTWADTRDAHVPLEMPGAEHNSERVIKADRPVAPVAPVVPVSPSQHDRAEERRVNNGLHDGQHYTNR
jgi:hypothetical protein